MPGDWQFNDGVRSDSRERPVQNESNRDYFIGTNEEKQTVEAVFDSSSYFGATDGGYEAAGIQVDVTQEGIEYDAAQGVDDKVMTEFVDGIIRSFDDVNDQFRFEVEEEVYESAKGVAPSGGSQIMSDIDHGNGEVQHSFQRGYQETDKVGTSIGPQGEETEYEDTDPDGVMGM